MPVIVLELTDWDFWRYSSGSVCFLVIQIYVHCMCLMSNINKY